MTRLERWKEEEKERIDSMSAKDLAFEIIDDTRGCMCSHCFYNIHKIKPCGKCTDGIVKYYEEEV